MISPLKFIRPIETVDHQYLMYLRTIRLETLIRPVHQMLDLIMHHPVAAIQEYPMAILGRLRPHPCLRLRSIIALNLMGHLKPTAIRPLIGNYNLIITKSDTNDGRLVR